MAAGGVTPPPLIISPFLKILVKMFYIILLLAFYPFYLASKVSSFSPGKSALCRNAAEKKEDMGDYFWAARAQTQCMPCFTACF
jgi:hypothetical protein